MREESQHAMAAATSAAAWTLRVRLPQGQVVSLAALPPDTTSTQALFDEVQTRLPRNTALAQLLHDFPPVVLDISPQVLLSSTSLQNNCTLTASAQPPPEKKRKRRKSAAGAAFNSTEDVGSALAQAVSGGGGGRLDATFGLLRRATRAAMLDYQEDIKANARYAAALGGHFSVEEKSSGRLGSSMADNETQLVVTYKRGPRATATETVDRLEESVLRAAIAHVLAQPDEAARENLRPHVIARLSPRVFWSLVRLPSGGDVAKGLRDLLPQADFSFLDARKRTASERALAAQQSQDQERQRKSRGRKSAGNGRHAEVEEDDLHWAFAELATRQKLRRAGCTSLADVAQAGGGAKLEAGLVDAAREVLVQKWMDDVVLAADRDQWRDALAGLEIVTPADVARLRIPGRTEFVRQELGLADAAHVETWKQRASALLQEHGWLGEWVTRG